MARRIEVEGVSVGASEREMRGVTWSMRMRIVWRGSSVSQDSIHCGVGSKEPLAE